MEAIKVGSLICVTCLKIIFIPKDGDIMMEGEWKSRECQFCGEKTKIMIVTEITSITDILN